jgi:hypothetical protein
MQWLTEAAKAAAAESKEQKATKKPGDSKANL